MNKKLVNQRTKDILVSIHRGFLTTEASDKLTDLEILEMVPKNSRNPKALGDTDNSIMVLTPFTEKWVRKQVKANVNVTSLEILRSMGFVDQEVT